MSKKYAPPIPDASLHRPGDIDYFRELIAAAGLSQRGASKALGIDERTMRYKLTSSEGSDRRVNPLTYTEQYTLEQLADGGAGLAMVAEAAAPYGNTSEKPQATVWHTAANRPLTKADAGKIVVGQDRFGAAVCGTITRDGFGLVIKELGAQPLDVHNVPIDRLALYSLLDPPPA